MTETTRTELAWRPTETGHETERPPGETLLAAIRMALGGIFLWTFLDKTFGLGFSTKPADAWIAGASPTAGYLQYAVEGPLAGVFQAMAANPLVDWLFMLAMGLGGLALLLGVAVRPAAIATGATMGMIYLSAFPPAHNPLLDEHLVYILVLGLVGWLNAGRIAGLGEWWSTLPVVRDHPMLK